MNPRHPQTTDRIKGLVGAVALQALLGYALLIGLAPGTPARLAERALIYVAPPPPKPEPPPVPPRATAPKPQGAAAPPNRRAKATPIVVPPPIIPIIVPPPIIAAPLAGAGAENSAGAAPIAGPGSGSGGTGDGSGAGDAGEGDGGGGTPPRRLRGRIRDSDYPRDAAQARIGGRLLTRYRIDPDGRVGECSIVESSGNALLDATTCRIVIERYRYKPARDAAGRKISATILQDHEWVIEPPPPRVDP